MRVYKSVSVDFSTSSGNSDPTHWTCAHTMSIRLILGFGLQGLRPRFGSKYSSEEEGHFIGSGFELAVTVYEGHVFI